MSDVNCVVLSGRLTADPVMRATPKGMPVASVRLASDRFYADKKDVVFIDVSVFSKTAENVGKYLKKGDPVIVRGQLELDVWDGKDGKKHQKYRIIAQEVVFLPRSKKKSAVGDGAAAESGTGRDDYDDEIDMLPEIPARAEEAAGERLGF